MCFFKDLGFKITMLQRSIFPSQNQNNFLLSGHTQLFKIASVHVNEIHKLHNVCVYFLNGHWPKSRLKFWMDGHDSSCNECVSQGLKSYIGICAVGLDFFGYFFKECQAGVMCMMPRTYTCGQKVLDKSLYYFINQTVSQKQCKWYMG